MAHNTYIRDGVVTRCEWCVMLTGRKLYDPNALSHPHSIPRDQMGRPHEMVLHIAGVTYYPTRNGYERI